MTQKRLLNWIELSRKALKQNITSLYKLAGKSKLAVCVKANAYGHGLDQIVKMLKDDKRVSCLTVHSIDEAGTCRNAGWERKIMLLGPVPLGDVEAVHEFDVEPVVSSVEFLRRLGRLSDKTKRFIPTHLKLETGTNRQGITEKELGSFSQVYKKHRYLKKPYGVSTHFANIEDTTNHEYALFQLKNFNRMTAKMKQLGIGATIRHAACSAALILFKTTRFDLVRPGIALYGYWPSKETYLTYRLEGGKNDLFAPVLSWKTRVTQLKRLAADEFVGYGVTYRTTSATKMAVLPVGYADGYDRSLSNQAYVLVNGRRAPVRGRVCMNLTMVDVTDVGPLRLEDEITLLGRSGSESLTADDLAGWAATINYEILARISPQLPRRVT